MIAVTWSEPDEIRERVRATQSLTTRPFGVNLIIDEPQDDRLAAALESGVKVVSFFWGDPAPYLERVHEAGAHATLTVDSAAEATAAVGAGHVRGEVSTLVLVPAVVGGSARCR